MKKENFATNLPDTLGCLSGQKNNNYELLIMSNT
jgi:hypothetical protein